MFRFCYLEVSMSDKKTLFFVMLLIATVHCFSDIYAPFLLNIGQDFGVDETARNLAWRYS